MIQTAVVLRVVATDLYPIEQQIRFWSSLLCRPPVFAPTVGNQASEVILANKLSASREESTLTESRAARFFIASKWRYVRPGSCREPHTRLFVWEVAGLAPHPWPHRFRFLPLLNNPTFPAGNYGLGDEKRTAYVWLCISLPGLRRAGEMR